MGDIDFVLNLNVYIIYVFLKKVRIKFQLSVSYVIQNMVGINQINMGLYIFKLE